MRWIVIAIVAILVPYTWFNLQYRKPGRAFEPYHDMKKQANVQSLLSAGFRRITLSPEQPADQSPDFALSKGPFAEAKVTAGGIPAQLRESLIETPTLPQSIHTLKTLAETSHLLPYPIEFDCTLPDQRLAIANAYLYWKEEELILVVDCEKLQGDLTRRTPAATLRLTAPGGSVPVGNYLVTLVGEKQSLQWSLRVK